MNDPLFVGLLSAGGPVIGHCPADPEVVVEFHPHPDAPVFYSMLVAAGDRLHDSGPFPAAHAADLSLPLTGQLLAVTGRRPGEFWWLPETREALALDPPEPFPVWSRKLILAMIAAPAKVVTGFCPELGQVAVSKGHRRENGAVPDPLDDRRLDRFRQRAADAGLSVGDLIQSADGWSFFLGPAGAGGLARSLLKEAGFDLAEVAEVV